MSKITVHTETLGYIPKSTRRAASFNELLEIVAVASMQVGMEIAGPRETVGDHLDNRLAAMRRRDLALREIYRRLDELGVDRDARQ